MRLRPNVDAAEGLDEQVAAADFEPTRGRWIRTARELMGLPITTLAARLGISKQAISKLEQSEQAGTISIAKLEEVADALECDLVYAFVPRKSFAAAAERLQKQQDKARRAKRKIEAPK